MRGRDAWLSLLLIFASSLGVHAKDRPEWFELRSANFHVVSNAKPKRIQELTRKLEEFRYLLSGVFPRMRLDPPVPTSVVFFKDNKSYRPYRPLTPTGEPLEAEGYMQPAPEGMYLAVNLGGFEPLHTAYHEYMHLVMHLNLERAPVWLNEGLAQFFENAEIDGVEFTLGNWEPSSWELLKRRKLVPLDVLVRVDQDSDYYNVEDKRRLFYAQSWLLVHYLRVADEAQRSPQFNKFIQLLWQGVSQDSSFRQAFGTDYAGMLVELRDYLTRQSVSFYRGKLQRSADLSLGEPAPLSEDVAKAYLADLWLNSGRISEAEKALQQVAATGTASPEILYRLGRIALEQQQPGEAEKHFRAALSVRPHDIALHYYAAWALSLGRLASGMGGEERQAAANQVVELLSPVLEHQRNFPAAYDLLVQARLARNDAPAELIPVLEQACALMPQRYDLKLLLAHFYERERRWEGTEKILLQVVSQATDENQRRQAQDWLPRLASLREFEEGEPTQPDVREPAIERKGIRPGGEPVEPPAVPSPAEPAPMAYVRGVLIQVACSDDSAAITVQSKGRKGETGEVIHLAVRSRKRVIILDPTRSGWTLPCGPAGVPVGINYRREPQGPSIAGTVVSIEAHPPGARHKS
jgi:tetratricopeptide (TPR) repeat protein